MKNDGQDLHDPDDGDRCERLREPEEINPSELDRALRGLTLFSDDTYLGMQATNIAVVDAFIMGQETLARDYRDADEGIDFAHAMFLNAQSQMWLMASCELLRTWRQRVRAIRDAHRDRQLLTMIKKLEHDEDYLHVGHKTRAKTMQRVLDDPSVLQGVDDDLLRKHVVFGMRDFLRNVLAKRRSRARSAISLMRPDTPTLTCGRGR